MLAAIDIAATALRAILFAGLILVLRPWIRAQGWRTTPVTLLAFIGFAVVVVALDAIVSMMTPSLLQDLIPFTGWVPEMLYAFGAAMGVLICVKRAHSARVALLVTLGLWSAGHILEFITNHGQTTSDNPYIRVSAFRPIWTVVIPLIWMVILMSPRLKKYCSDPEVRV